MNTSSRSLFVLRVAFLPRRRKPKYRESLIIHHGKDIDAAGDEVEIAFRKVLRRKIASSYYIGHGHIVDQELHQSPQLDVIITDNAGTPILLRTENGTEYFPYEGVYAIGEVKSSYKKSEQYIHKFADRLTDIHTHLARQVPEPHFVLRWTGTPSPYSFHESPLFSLFEPVLDSVYENPLFSFMFFADAGDFRIEDVIDLYQTRPRGELPNIVCLLNKGVIVNRVTHADADKLPLWGALQLLLQPGVINVTPAHNLQTEDVHHQWVLLEYGTTDQQPAAHLSTLHSLLATHLRECRLTIPNLVAYLAQLFDQPTQSVIV